MVRAWVVLGGRVAGRGDVLALQHLTRMGPQGGIVRKGAGGAPLVTGPRIKAVIGERWEIHRVGRTPLLRKKAFMIHRDEVTEAVTYV